MRTVAHGVRAGSLLLLGAVVGLLGESVLVLRAHCLRIEGALLEDFRVLAFLKENLEDSRLRVVEEKLRALEGVEALRYVSSAESLREIERDDPDMTRSVALLGDNPLPGAFEVQIGAGQVARMPQWQKALEAVPELGEVRYKPLEARAVVAAEFYARFLTLTFALAACLCLAWAGWSGAMRLLESADDPGAGLRALLCLLGALAGMAVGLAFSAPAAVSDLARAWPSAGGQLLLAAAAGAVGFAFQPGRAARAHARRAGREGVDAGAAAEAEGDRLIFP